LHSFRVSAKNVAEAAEICWAFDEDAAIHIICKNERSREEDFNLKDKEFLS